MKNLDTQYMIDRRPQNVGLFSIKFMSEVSPDRSALRHNRNHKTQVPVSATVYDVLF